MSNDSPIIQVNAFNKEYYKPGEAIHLKRYAYNDFNGIIDTVSDNSIEVIRRSAASSPHRSNIISVSINEVVKGDVVITKLTFPEEVKKNEFKF